MRSTIIGTDKQDGLAVYDLAGNQLHYPRVVDTSWDPRAVGR